MVTGRGRDPAAPSFVTPKAGNAALHNLWRWCASLAPPPPPLTALAWTGLRWSFMPAPLIASILSRHLVTLVGVLFSQINGHEEHLRRDHKDASTSVWRGGARTWKNKEATHL